MNKITNLYTNGCSFTYDNHIYYDLKEKSYGDLLAKKYNLSYQNNALPGSCNRRIIRNTLRDALNLDSTTLVIVQLSLLSRTEKSYTPGQNNEWKMNNKQTTEEYHESIKENPEEKLNNEYFLMHMRYFDEKAAITDIAADLIMLTAFLQNKGIPYYIFPYQPMVSTKAAESLKNDAIQKYLSRDPRIMNILTDSLVTRLGSGDFFYDGRGIMYGQIGHLHPAGHVKCADILATLLVNQYAELM